MQIPLHKTFEIRFHISGWDDKVRDIVSGPGNGFDVHYCMSLVGLSYRSIHFAPKDAQAPPSQ